MRCHATTTTGHRAERGMTLVELCLALGVLTVAVGCLIEVLGSVSVGQEGLAKRQEAMRTAQNTAEDVLDCDGDWQALCTAYDAEPNIDVTVEDGDGDPGSGWSKITVRVAAPSLKGGPDQHVTLVLGRTTD
jgi:type II secretory pathway pseudopilin PulG